MDYFRQTKGTDTKALSGEQRADIVAMREDGSMPSEISKQMGISVEIVNSVLLNAQKKIKRGSDPDDPIQAARQEIALLQLEQQKQEMVWKAQDRENQRQDRLRDELESALDDDSAPDSDNTMLMMFLQSFMQGRQNNQAPGASTLPAPQNSGAAHVAAPGAIEMNDDAIIEIMEQYPRETAILKKLSPDQQVKTLKSRFPQLADSTISRGLEILNNQNPEEPHGKTKILSTGKK